MSKKLSEMTLDELWQLFPIMLTEHKECWKDYYSEEKAVIEAVLPNGAIINHIGSTAIPNILAKPTVDILAEVDGNLAEVADLLVKIGYTIMSTAPTRISLNKGYTEQGFAERVFHLHLRLVGDNDEIYFRDYLISHPDAAKEYEKLKLSLWHKYEFNRDAYTEAKSDFVAKYTSLAKAERKL